jgi:mRNA interferase YafQ
VLNIDHTTQFKRDLKLAKRRQKSLKKIQNIMEKIAAEESLDKKLHDHPLTGPWRGFRELHIEPDWLLIYEITADKKTVVFTRTGTHADLF